MKRIEFSKIVLAAVMISFFIALFIGTITVLNNPDMLPELLAFVGAPTSVAIGFYAWKAKSENIIKLKKQEFIDDEIEKLKGD